MTTLRELRQRVHHNLLILKEREARYAGSPPLDLLNQIQDHQTALELINQALNQPNPDLEALKEALRPLLVAANIEQLDLDNLKPELPLQPYEPETVLIPAGPFWMGQDAGPEIPPEETPRHQLDLPAYRIGKYPVTHRQYAVFIQQNPAQKVPQRAGWFLREPPSDLLDHPVVGVNWADAVAYCRWLSEQTGRYYRLPTEAEWEKAAAWTGSEARLYPWGNRFEPGRCNSREAGLNRTTPVGAYSPQGDSPAGCADMAGNVQEWVSTLWGSDLQKSDYPYPYRPDDGREALTPPHLYRVYRVYRGGSFRDDRFRVRCSARGRADPDARSRWRGFRVVREER